MFTPSINNQIFDFYQQIQALYIRNLRLFDLRFGNKFYFRIFLAKMSLKVASCVILIYSLVLFGQIDMAQANNIEGFAISSFSVQTYSLFLSKDYLLQANVQQLLQRLGCSQGDYVERQIIYEEQWIQESEYAQMRLRQCLKSKNWIKNNSFETLQRKQGREENQVYGSTDQLGNEKQAQKQQQRVQDLTEYEKQRDYEQQDQQQYIEQIDYGKGQREQHQEGQKLQNEEQKEDSSKYYDQTLDKLDEFREQDDEFGDQERQEQLKYQQKQQKSRKSANNQKKQSKKKAIEYQEQQQEQEYEQEQEQEQKQEQDSIEWTILKIIGAIVLFIIRILIK